MCFLIIRILRPVISTLRSGRGAGGAAVVSLMFWKLRMKRILEFQSNSSHPWCYTCLSSWLVRKTFCSRRTWLSRDLLAGTYKMYTAHTENISVYYAARCTKCSHSLCVLIIRDQNVVSPNTEKYQRTGETLTPSSHKCSCVRKRLWYKLYQVNSNFMLHVSRSRPFTNLKS